MRLVNVGASSAIGAGEELGYAGCTVCGQSVSPLSSERQRSQFPESHRERRGRVRRPIGFYADVVADALSLPACDRADTAYSILEALRFGAAQVLDMHMDDLQILVIGHVDREQVDGLLWDPMPGGSGLLQRLCERFPAVVEAACEVVANCPAACSASCIDCLQTFRNAYYHPHLDRATARDRLDEWGVQLSFSHEIPPLQPTEEPRDNGLPVNDAETRLRHLLRAAGFGEGVRGEQIRLNRALGTTTPDVIYRSEDHDPDEGVCIYLDGLSAQLHGNPETAERDREFRDWLRNSDYDVIEIAANDLHDAAAMTRHFRKLAQYLGMRDTRRPVREDPSWFHEPEQVPAAQPSPLRLVTPTPEERYVTCVPLVPLHLAAGEFGDPDTYSEESEREWVELDTTRSLRHGMFVARVEGKSMEPRIPDGSYCLFAGPVTGSRQGRTVLARMLNALDPDTGQRFTVKRYRSEKTVNEDGWRHLISVLEPFNPDYKPIELTAEDESPVHPVAELIKVVGTEAPVDAMDL